MSAPGTELADDAFAGLFGAGRGAERESERFDQVWLDLRAHGGWRAAIEAANVNFYRATPRPDAPAEDVCQWGEFACGCSRLMLAKWLVRHASHGAQVSLSLGVDVTLAPDAVALLDLWLKRWPAL